MTLLAGGFRVSRWRPKRAGDSRLLWSLTTMLSATAKLARKVRGKFMRKFLSLVIVIISAMVSGSAQTGQDLKRSLESKHVTSKVDVPATRNTDEDVSYIRQTAYSYSADDFKPGVVQVGPRTMYLKEGFSTEEVVRLLGKPSAISERNEKDVVVTIYEFQRSEGRILIAEFVKGGLVRFTMETRGQVAKADR
jgi:hypothetical protein